MGVLSFLVFTAIWYLPMFLKHRKVVAEPVKYYMVAFLLGIVAMALGSAVQLGVRSVVFMATGTALSTGVANVIYSLIKTFLLIALVEEGLKLFFGSKVVAKIPELSEAGCMVILAMTGLGWEFMESAFQSTELFTAVLRGVTELHLFFQLWMGKYLWRAWEARKAEDTAGYKKNMRTALWVPVIVHFIFDWFVSFGGQTEDTGTAMIFTIIGFAVGIAFTIIGLRMAYKTLKEEKAAAANVAA